MRFKGFKLTVAAVLALAVSMPGCAAEHLLSADVVVVGGGAAGMAASVKAAENGAKVILLEKNGMVGGGGRIMLKDSME